MAPKATKPFRRNRSRTVVVPGEFAGQPVPYEVHTEEWLHRPTGGYARLWSARQQGALGWHVGASARKALMGAACLHDPPHPFWLTQASAQAERELR